MGQQIGCCGHDDVVDGPRIAPVAAGHDRVVSVRLPCSIVLSEEVTNVKFVAVGIGDDPECIPVDGGLGGNGLKRVDGNKLAIDGPGQGLGERDTDTEAGEAAGALADGDQVERTGRDPMVGQQCGDNRGQSLGVPEAVEFEWHLGQAVFVAAEGDRAGTVGGFDSQHEHGEQPVVAC